MAVEKPASIASSERSDDRLLVDAAQKDPARFAVLYEHNFELVYAYIARRVRDRSAAEDLTSEVFQKALEHLPGFTWRGVPFAAWLLRIASNIVKDRSKRAAKAPQTADLEEAIDISQVNLEELEQRACVFRFVDQLPEDQCRVVKLRFAEGKSIREIAGELGRTEGAVKQLQFRGLQSLRAQFAGKSGEQNG